MPARRGPLILSVVGAPYREDMGGHHFIRITRGCPESQGAGRRATGKLLSNLRTDDVPEIDTDVVDGLLKLKKFFENNDYKLNLYVHISDGSHHGVNV